MEQVVGSTQQQEMLGLEQLGSQDLLAATQGLITPVGAGSANELQRRVSLGKSGGLGPQEIKNMRKRRSFKPLSKDVVNEPQASRAPQMSEVSPLDAGVRVSPSRTVNTPDIEETLRPPNVLERQRSSTEITQLRNMSPSVYLVPTKSMETNSRKIGRNETEEKVGMEPSQPVSVSIPELQQPAPQSPKTYKVLQPPPAAPAIQPPPILPPPRRLKNLFDDDDEDHAAKKEYEEHYRKYLEYQVSLKNAKTQQEKDYLARQGAFFEIEDDETARRRRLAQQSQYRKELGAMSQRTPSMPSIDEMGEWDLLDGEITPRNKEKYRRALEEQMRNQKREDIGLQFMAGFELEGGPDGQRFVGVVTASPEQAKQIISKQSEISHQVRELQRITENIFAADTNPTATKLDQELADLESELAKLEKTQQQVVKSLDTSKSSRKMRRIAMGNDSVETQLGMEVHQALAELEHSQQRLTVELQTEVDAHTSVIEQEVREFENWLQQTQNRRLMSTEDKMAMLDEKYAQIQGTETLDVNHINETFKSQFAESVERAMQQEAQRAVEEEVGKPILDDLLTQLQQLLEDSDENEQQLIKIQNDVKSALDTLTHNIAHIESELAGTPSLLSLPDSEDEIPEWIINVIEERFVELESDPTVDQEVQRITTPDMGHIQASYASNIAMSSIARKLQRQLWNQERVANGVELWDIVKNMVRADAPNHQRLVDPSQSYAVGAVLHSAPAGLPVTFTVYTVLEDSTPCTCGGANVVAFAKPHNTESETYLRSSVVQDNAILQLQDSREGPATPGNQSRQLSGYSQQSGLSEDPFEPNDPDAFENPREIVLINQGQREVVENDLPMDVMRSQDMPQGEGNRNIRQSTLRNLLTFNWLKKNKGQHGGTADEDREMVREACEVLQRLREMQAAYWGPKNGYPLSVRDMENGSYYITGQFPQVGEYEVHVLINNNHIYGSPFLVHAVQALHVGNGFGSDKLVLIPQSRSRLQYNQSVLYHPAQTSTNVGLDQVLQTDSQRPGTVVGLNRSRSTSSASQHEIQQMRPASAPPRAQASFSGVHTIPNLLDPNSIPMSTQLNDQIRLKYAQNHPCIGDIDLVFLVDGTASMLHELRMLAEQLPHLCANIQQLPLCKSLRVALLLYNDHHQVNNASQIISRIDFTDDFDEIARFLDQFEAKGGGDYPEAMEYALEMCGNLPWREHSCRMAVILGDAPPHGYEGLHQFETAEKQEQLEDAKAEVMIAAAKLEKYILKKGFSQNRKVVRYEFELEQALNKADAIAQYYDEYSQGAPGGHQWQEASQKLSDLGVTVIAFGFRELISHEPSQACLRAIAHMTHGALLALPDTTAEAVNDFIVLTCGVLLSRSLVLEELVDLALSTRSKLTAIGHEQRLPEVCNALNAAGCSIVSNEGHFAEDEREFMLAQKQLSLNVELLSPIIRQLIQKSHVVMNGLARQYTNDPMRWVVDAWTQVQRDLGLHEDRVRGQFNRLELTLIKNRKLMGTNISPFDLRYVLAHAILSSGY